jgi:hypothetical protein
MRSGVLFEELRGLEMELHRIDVRRDAGRLSVLLHRDFREFARSGVQYDRAAVLDEFSSGAEMPAVHAQDFELAALDAGTALLTYRSAHVDAAGNLHRCTLRSSLWTRTDGGWQLRFHQGTPTEDFTRSKG